MRGRDGSGAGASIGINNYVDSDENDEETNNLLSSSSDHDQFGFLLHNLRQGAIAAVRKTAGDVTGTSGARKEDVGVIESIREQISNLCLILQQRSALLARHIELLNRSMDHLWIDPDEARAAQQLLLPRAKRALEDIDQMLWDACALELASTEP